MNFTKQKNQQDQEDTCNIEIRHTYSLISGIMDIISWIFLFIPLIKC